MELIKTWELDGDCKIQLYMEKRTWPYGNRKYELRLSCGQETMVWDEYDDFTKAIDEVRFLV